MSIKENMWKGGKGDPNSIYLAVVVTPFLSEIALLAHVALGSIIIAFDDRYGPLTLALYMFFSAVISFVVVLIYALPVFLLLARMGFAGLFPNIAAGLLPGALLLCASHNSSDGRVYVTMFLASGVLIESGFWFIARQPWPRQMRKKLAV